MYERIRGYQQEYDAWLASESQCACGCGKKLTPTYAQFSKALARRVGASRKNKKQTRSVTLPKGATPHSTGTVRDIHCIFSSECVDYACVLNWAGIFCDRCKLKKSQIKVADICDDYGGVRGGVNS